MIKNDRQYRMTKAQVRSFSDALASIDRTSLPEGFDPALRDIERRALQSQQDELAAEVAEYEALKSGALTEFEAASLADLPVMLVKARISRGLTQKQLAQRLSLKEQQVQRWEGTNYQHASLENLKIVAEALGVIVRQELIVPQTSLTAETFLSALKKAGLSADLLLDRLMPPTLASTFRDGVASLKEIAQAASIVARVFGTKVPDVLRMNGSVLPLPTLVSVRFKLPARASAKAVDAYVLYAHYLSTLIVDSLNLDLPFSLPASPQEFYKCLTDPSEPMTFTKALEFAWNHGMVVVPLREAGGFYGAVWKIRGRFVIILKQTTSLDSRWLNDLLHETGHIQKGHVTEDTAIVEESEISPDATDEEEDAANEWAEDTLFNSRSEEIEKACQKACQGKLQRLKAVLPGVAADFNVNLGALANHLAYRLSQEGQNWWGAANNLQAGRSAPFTIACEMLLKNIDLNRLNQFDRDLVQRALSER